MSLFLWKKSYELGIPEIDMQHRRLVGFINELSDAMMEKRGYKVVGYVVDKLQDYIQLHFTTEERYMRSMEYPDFDKHCQDHLEMTHKVIELKDRCALDQCPEAMELLTFLCDWFKSHIIESDQEYGEFSRGLKKG